MNTFSLIIPVYNRPDEVQELLESIVQQIRSDFEVIIVEDGSESDCRKICESFQDRLNLHYFYKENTGPGQSRNYGFERAQGTYGIFMDSDCILPPHYFETVAKALEENYVDAFGGSDMAHKDFSNLQKAISYSMTSFFTTGGIRGHSEKLDKFHPRSFNMGFSREVFETTKGFPKLRLGEDIDMSIRILASGFKTRLIQNAWVYHKRRSSLQQFYKQVRNFGIGRINLHILHPGSLKLVHMAPAIFTIGSVLLLILGIFVHPAFLSPIGLYIALIFIHSAIINKNLFIGAYSIITSYIQLFGYGIGFLSTAWNRLILKKEEYSSYEKLYHK